MESKNKDGIDAKSKKIQKHGASIRVMANPSTAKIAPAKIQEGLNENKLMIPAKIPIKPARVPVTLQRVEIIQDDSSGWFASF